MSSESTNDPYWKLRPLPPTPDDEVCHCAACRCVMLRDTLTENPLQCVECNGEVTPERIGFDESFAGDIANWRGIFRSLYLLWLDSDEYEPWARERLLDKNGAVNVRGREVVSQLNQVIRAYYWWFEDTGLADPSAPKSCPICGAILEPCKGRQFRKCEPCSILV